ncbi:MAG: hypothetical protein K2G90_03650 [Muribaculaceae bacterium]|nr:hypothetical protein [Muribaculaceae bacterium]
MKRFIKIFCILSLVWLAACSNGSSYNQQECSSLVEKIKSNEELTEKDYDSMIDQFGSIVTWMAGEKKAVGGDEKAFKEALSSEEGKQKAEYMIYFGLQLEKDKDKLSASNVVRLAKYMKEMQEIKK